MTTLLTVNDLKYSYKNKDKLGQHLVLDGIDFTLSRGEYLTISGGSGIGKTTLLHLIAGLDQPTQGKIKFKELLLNNLSKKQLSEYRLGYLGIVFQNYNLIPSLTLFENIETPLGLVGIGSDERRRRTNAILEMLNLTHQATNLPTELSGGELKRGSIGRAIINNPDLLLVDEPISGLDKENKKNVLNILNHQNKSGTTIISTTHNDEVRFESSQHYELKEGKLFNLKEI